MGFIQGLSSSFINLTQGISSLAGCVLALVGYRPPGRVSAGPVRVQAARRGLCRPCEGTDRQEGSLPAL